MPIAALARRALAAVALLLLVSLAPAARADAPPSPPAPGSWGAQLESLAAWLESQKPAPHPCAERCFVLARLHLSGPADGAMTFSLEGAVLAGAPVAVPLFGPPGHARVARVTDHGKPADVGFEGDHWFVMAPPGRFVVEGTLTIDSDLALTIPGPLDALDADLSRGRVVEGAHLSGLRGASVHLDRAAAGAPAPEPPLFQLSRALRIGREVAFEYRLVLRSGQDLGVVRLPMPHGERVLDVQGSTGWSVAGRELVLPTAGRAAQITVTGTLPAASRFEPDARSAYEWWLVESDAEHRVAVGGDARQLDASESPIPRTQPGARLMLVSRGQHLEVTVASLVASEVLAAVVRSHDRTTVLTSQGDQVTDETFFYENNGIDWLPVPTSGRAVFLSTDGRPERVMRAADGDGEVQVPLRVGTHGARLQSVAASHLGLLGGSLSLPVPPVALTTSRANVTIGLPRGVYPVAALGGDRPWLAWGLPDALALAASVGLALLLRGRGRRALGALALGGLWLASPGPWIALVAIAAAGAVAWAAARLLSRRLRLATLGGALVVLLAAALGATRAGSHAPAMIGDDKAAAGDLARPASAPAAPAARADRDESGKDAPARAATKVDEPSNALGESSGRLATGGLVQGVAPVALGLPEHDRSVSVSRELVTRERPLVPTVVYVTTAGLAPLAALWLLSIGLLVRLHRPELARLRTALRERLARRPELTPAPAA